MNSSDLVAGARHVVMPAGVSKTSWPRIRAISETIGVFHDPWQADLNRCILAKDEAGKWAADTVVLSIARQVGKTFDIGSIMFAECIATPGTTVIWTAHRFKVARESFQELSNLAKTPNLWVHIDQAHGILTAAGNEQIIFRNGSRIVFAARERGAIRGFSKVRFLVLDEAQILTAQIMSDLAPTMNQADNPLVIMMGTPPKPGDKSEVFLEQRSAALKGETDGVLYVEFSGDPGAEASDQSQIHKANPGYMVRTPKKAIDRLRRLLSEDDFRREVLGIWDTDQAYLVIPEPAWTALRVSGEPARHGTCALAVHSTFDRSWTCVVRCVATDDGPIVEVLERRKGIQWATDFVAETLATGPCYGVWVDSGAAAAPLIDDMRMRGMPVVPMGTTEAKQAFGEFYDACMDTGSVRHAGQSDLTAAVSSVADRAVGDGRLWDGKRELSDVVIAATNAHYGFVVSSRRGMQLF